MINVYTCKLEASDERAIKLLISQLNKHVTKIRIDRRNTVHAQESQCRAHFVEIYILYSIPIANSRINICCWSGNALFTARERILAAAIAFCRLNGREKFVRAAAAGLWFHVDFPGLSLCHIFVYSFLFYTG